MHVKALVHISKYCIFITVLVSNLNNTTAPIQCSVVWCVSPGPSVILSVCSGHQLALVITAQQSARPHHPPPTNTNMCTSHFCREHHPAGQEEQSGSQSSETTIFKEGRKKELSKLPWKCLRHSTPWGIQLQCCKHSGFICVLFNINLYQLCWPQIYLM